MKKATDKIERTEMVAFRVSPQEKEIIEKLAKRQKMNVSQYVLATLIMDMFISGDPEATKYAVSSLGVGFRSSLRSFFFPEKENDEEGHGKEVPA